MFFQIVHPLVKILPVSTHFLFLKCSCGSCHRPLPHGHFKTKKCSLKKKSCAVTPFFKNVFPSSPSKWKRSSTRARDQKYQLKPKCGHTCCVHTCCRDVDNPGTRFKFFFQHEINHSPLLFRRTHFLKHRAVTLTLLRRIWRPLRHIIVGSA